MSEDRDKRQQSTTTHKHKAQNRTRNRTIREGKGGKRGGMCKKNKTRRTNRQTDRM